MGLTKKGRKKIIITILWFWLAGLTLFIRPSLSRAADSDVNDIKERISEKENEKKELEKERKELQQGKNRVQAMINDLQGKKQELAAVVTELDEEVARVEEELKDLNRRIDEKELEIAETREELLQAEENAVNQYEAMKLRIRFMYERGESLNLELMLGASSFSDMLNKAEYIQMLSDYDRKKLQEYRLVVDDVRVTKELLEEEEAVLEETRQAAEDEADDLNALIDEKSQQIEAYQKEIEDDEEALAAYEADMKAQDAVIAAVEAQANGLPCLLSNHVPHELDLCTDVYHLPIDAGPEPWVQIVLNLPGKSSQEREQGAENVRKAGFGKESMPEYVRLLYGIK